jgi:hypothetical protein
MTNITQLNSQYCYADTNHPCFVGEYVKMVDGEKISNGTMVEIKDNNVKILAFDSLDGFTISSTVIFSSLQLSVEQSNVLLSHTLNAFGEPQDEQLNFIFDRKNAITDIIPDWRNVKHRIPAYKIENNLHKINLNPDLEIIKILCLASQTNETLELNTSNLSFVKILSQNPTQDKYAQKTSLILANFFADSGKFVEVYFDPSLNLDNKYQGYSLESGGRVELYF